MDGLEYEKICAIYIKKLGFNNVSITKGTGDQGVDIIAYKNKEKYGFQCKYYSHPVGNKAIQEVFAGGRYYCCNKTIVITNNTFTRSAVDLASKLGVELWDSKDEKIGRIELRGSHYTTTIFDVVIGIFSLVVVLLIILSILSFVANLLFVRVKMIQAIVHTTLLIVIMLTLIYFPNSSKIIKLHFLLNSLALKKIGIDKEEWSKKTIENEEIINFINKIKMGRSKLNWFELFCCQQLVIVLCNEYNSRIDDFYNKNCDTEFDETTYISAKDEVITNVGEKTKTASFDFRNIILSNKDTTQSIAKQETKKNNQNSTRNEQAVNQANSYINSGPFSKKELIEQLIFDGFTKEQAEYSAKVVGYNDTSRNDSLNFEKENALLAAKNYLSSSNFSFFGLVEQLKYDSYSKEASVYATINCGANWNEQAASQARSYIDNDAFSKKELIDQLIFDGFTKEQAEYGANAIEIRN